MNLVSEGPRQTCIWVKFMETEAFAGGLGRSPVGVGLSGKIFTKENP
jgi:hypothetical protein